MPDAKDHTMPDVSTEPQRHALDEMSHQLVERLNDMVREQNERARRFAATQHSLSHLPGLPTLEPAPPPAPAEAEPPLPPSSPPVPAPRNKHRLPNLLPTKPKKPQDFDNIPAPDTDWLKRANAEAADKKQGEESGCGTIPTIILIAIILIIIKSCS